MGFERFILNIKRAETPYYRFLKSLYKAFLNASLPTPSALRPVGNALYHAHYGTRTVFNRIVTVLYRDPLFRYRCESVGKRLKLALMPDAPGHTAIYLGDDVTFHGKLGIYSGRVFDRPVLRIGNRVSIGHQVNFSCNREIVIEDDVYIANNCMFSDNDGYPLDPHLRAAGYPPPAERTRPVHICRYVWIGASCFILKGVTIGEASIVGAGSVVTSDIPPFCVAAGNPAKVVKLLNVEPHEKVR